MLRNRTAKQHNFAIVPGAEIPRSKLRLTQTRKQAFDASDLIPIMCEEVLPGDVWLHTESIMARLATPIAPVVDDMDLETFYFFVPNRIVWPEWEDFITGVNTSVTVPTIIPRKGDLTLENPVGSVFDHFGILPQVYTQNLPVNALPIWGYFTIWNEWFRDQNLQLEWDWAAAWTSSFAYDITYASTPSPTAWNMMPLRVNKRSDYFTRSLPWPQKGTAVSLPLGSTAPVISNPAAPVPTARLSPSGVAIGALRNEAVSGDAIFATGAAAATSDVEWVNTGLIADLASATAATINSIRLAFQTQKLLERDARGGSRYVEQLMSHWSVRAQDFRLQRPEYLGGSKTSVTVNPIAQTATYGAEPDPESESAIGNLGAEMHVSSHRRTFNYGALEHGYIIGLACVRATPTYQQGTRRHWRRQTRLDFAFPVFSHLGEQAVATQEIYQDADNIPSNATWGYQERHAEYRYTPNEITGVLRSTAPQPLDWWHYAEEFGAEPTLSDSFIRDKTKETLARSLATSPSAQWSAQIIMDIKHDSVVARLLPAYADPGLIDHF